MNELPAPDRIAESWFMAMNAALIQGAIALVFVAAFVTLFRNRLSHAFAHGAFLLVPLKAAIAAVFALSAMNLPLNVPVPVAWSQPDPDANLRFESHTHSKARIVAAESAISHDFDPKTMPLSTEPIDVAHEAQSDLVIPPANSLDDPTDPEGSVDHSESTGQAVSKPAVPVRSNRFLLMSAWTIVVGVLILRWVSITVRFSRVVRRTQRPVDHATSQLVESQARLMGLRRVPRTVTTRAVGSPAVFGSFRPVLLLPEGFETAFDHDETRWAIAHELAHLKRRDLWAVAFERAVGLAGFFHPALWLARRATANFRELACDEVACRVTGIPPRACAETFLKILVWADGRPELVKKNPLALGLNPRFPAIRRRIENMTDPKISKRGIPRWLWCATPILATFVLLPVSPRFVAAEAPKTAITRDQDKQPDFEIQATDLATGQPVANAVVNYETDRASGKASTDANGRVTIPFRQGDDDFVSFRIGSDSHVPFRLRRSAVEDPDFPPASPFEAKLKPGMAIGGLVVDENGEPVHDARVLVTYRTNTDESSTGAYRCDLIRTDAEGRWKTGQVDPSAKRIDVAALHPAFAIDWEGTETDPRGRLEPPFETLKAGTHVFRLKKGQTLQGRVLDQDDQPIAGAEVRSDEWPVEFGEAPLLTDASGEFRIGNMGTVRAAVKIAVHKPGMGWCVRSIDVQDQDRVATFQLIPGRTIEGRVTDADGKPVAHVRIEDTMLPRSLVAPDAIRRTDAEGRFVIADLPADYLTLFFSKTGYTGYEARIDTTQTKTLDVVLKKRNVVEGRVTDAATGEPVREFRVIRLAQSGGHEVAFPVVGRHFEGRFRVLSWPYPMRDEARGDIVPEYRLKVEAEGYEPVITEPMKVDDSPRKLAFALKRSAPVKTIEGRVLKPDGAPAEGAAVAFYTPKGEGWPRYVPQFANGQLTGMTRSASLDSPSVRVELGRTDSDGKFRIPADVGHIGWIVTHESGVFRSPVAGPVEPGTPVAIQLGSPPRVRGVFLNEGKPQAKAQVWYAASSGGNENPIPTRDSVLTDEMGRFEIPHVVAGKFRLAFPGKELKGFWQFLGEPFEVRAGASTRVEVSMNEFGHRQVVFDETGKEISRSGTGEFANAFCVYGRATDAETGELLKRTRALFLTGLPGDDPDVWVQWAGAADGRFTAYAAVSKLSIDEVRKHDAWLVVFAPGYEPFVSPRPIPRGDRPVRMDVALKPVPASEPREISGRILRADGTPAKRAEIAFMTKTPPLKVGRSVARWQEMARAGMQDLDGPYPLQSDEDGRFRISSHEAVDRLTVLDSTGCALVTGEELAKSQGIIRLGPWARVEGRFEMKLPAEGRVLANVRYGNADIAWSPLMTPPGAWVRPDGGFVIERVLPGSHSVNLMIGKRRDHHSTTTAPLDPPVEPVNFTVKGGQTAHVVIAAKEAEQANPAEPKPVSKAETKSKPTEPSQTAVAGPPAQSIPAAAKPDPAIQAASGKFITGRVLKPDGTPAAGAEVAFFTPSIDGSRDFVPIIRNGRIDAIVNMTAAAGKSMFNTELTRTGADGSFRIPVESDRIGLVVTHESGGFRAAETGPVPSGPVELKLQPFGRAAGQWLIDGKPVDSKTLTFEYVFDNGPKESSVSSPFPIVTDEQGRFAVDTIVPGTVRFRYAKPSGEGKSHFIGGSVPVASGAMTKVRADVNDFGIEEAVIDDAGNAISKYVAGAKEPVFHVFGYATDADTGQPVTPVQATLMTGLKGDDVKIDARSTWLGKGSFRTAPFWSRNTDVSKEKIDPYLVVFANGYEPYVSPGRIERGNEAIRIDVRLKKVDAAKTKTYAGTIRLADGSPASGAKVGTTVVDEGISVGEAKFRWLMNANDTFEADETGKFRIVAPRELDTIFVSGTAGYAILKAADFIEDAGRNPEAKLTPWGRIEGRVKRDGKPTDQFEMTLTYDGIRLPSEQARFAVKIESEGTFRVPEAIAEPAILKVYTKTVTGRFVLQKSETVKCDPGEAARVEIDVATAVPAAPPGNGAGVQGATSDKPKSADSKSTVNTPPPKPKPEFPAPSGKFITGRVLKPDGTPAAGAELGFFTITDDRDDRFLPRIARDGRVEAIEHRAIVRGQWSNSEREPVRTDAEGRFRLPVWAERFGWCVTHDSGVLRSTKLVEMAEGETELKLEPWGRIDGKLLLDERPMADATLYYQPNFDIGQNRIMNPMSTGIGTNHPGMFVIERAMPGPYRISFPNPASVSGSTQGSDHDMTVPAGGTLRIDVNLTMFGWEERRMDDSGKVVDRQTFGAMRPGFRVYGQVIDTDTGVPVEPMKAFLVSGRKDDPQEIVAEERPGSVFAVGELWTRERRLKLSEVDPYLVVIAPGYEPYVSAERIKRGDSPVHHDVRLKKLPPEKTLTIEGQVLDPDGKTPYMAFFRNHVPGETVKVGETTFAWKFETQNPPFSVDQGRFRFTVRNAPGKLIFSNQVGFAEVEATEFAKLPGGVVRLEPWGKVRLRVLRNGKPDGDFNFNWDPREGWKLSFVPIGSLYPQEDGSFLIDRLPPMPVEMSLRKASNPEDRYFYKMVRLEAKPGQTTDVDVVVTDEELRIARETGEKIRSRTLDRP